MDTLTDLFDRVYVINCPHRGDRLATLDENIKDTGVADCSKMHVFAGVRGELSPPPKYWGASVGAWGCFQSHRRLIEDILNEDDESIDSILILEDDAHFLDDSQKRINQFMENVPEDWDQLYLGGQHTSNPEETGNDAVLKVSSTSRLHAYALRRKAFKKFYAHINEAPDFIGAFDHHIDHQVEIAHKQGLWNAYCPKSWIVGQAAGKSDIMPEASQEVRMWDVYTLLSSNDPVEPGKPRVSYGGDGERSPAVSFATYQGEDAAAAFNAIVANQGLVDPLK